MDGKRKGKGNSPSAKAAVVLLLLLLGGRDLLVLHLFTLISHCLLLFVPVLLASVPSAASATRNWQGRGPMERAASW